MFFVSSREISRYAVLFRETHSPGRATLSMTDQATGDERPSPAEHGSVFGQIWP
jgi:hypothetical protein